MKTLSKFLTFLFLFFILTACGGNPPLPPPAPDCAAPLYPVATRPLENDPDIFSVPTPPSDDETVLCPTPQADFAPPDDPTTGFVGGDLANLTLNPETQELRAVAVGDDMLALGWIEDGQVMVSLAKGARHMQTRSLGAGQDLGLGFSRANRVHVAYEVDGEIQYRIGDGGEHPSLFNPIYVDDGTNPQVLIDELNWAHVIFEQDGTLHRARHLPNNQWYTTFIANGTNPSAITFYNPNKDSNVFGIPADKKWFGILMAADRGGAVGIYRYLSWFNMWEQLIEFPIPAGQTLLGTAHLDTINHPDPASTESWVYASWVTVAPAPDPPRYLSFNPSLPPPTRWHPTPLSILSGFTPITIPPEYG